MDADLAAKVSGSVFDVDVITATLTGSTIVYDTVVSTAHDGLGADTLVGSEVNWSGDVPNGTADSSMRLHGAIYSGTWGSGAAQGGTLDGFNANFTGATLNGSAANAYGFHFDSTGITNTSSNELAGYKAVLDASAQAVNIDAGTTDHSAGNIIEINLDVNSASVDMINATIDVGTALSAAEIVRGSFFDMNPLAADADTAGLIGYDVLMTGISTSRSDLTGYKVAFDGTMDTDDTVTGMLIDGSSLTISSASQNLHGLEIAFASVTDTDYATGEFNALDITMPAAYQGTDTASAIKVTGAGAQIDVLTGAATIYGINEVLAAGTVGVFIDADTTDHTAGNIIDVDLGVNSASVNMINGNIDIGTLLSAAEVVRGVYLDINEAVVNADTSQILGAEFQMTAFATAANDLIGNEVNFDGTKSAAGDVFGLHVNADSLTLDHASATYAGVYVDASGMTNTSSATAYGVHSLVGSTADAAVFASDGTQTAALSDGTNSITANDAIVSSLNTDTTLPAPAAGTITAREFGDGAHHVTVLTLTAARIGAVAGAALGIGTQIYELPAGVQFFHVSDINIAFDNDDASCDADDPVYGIGSVVASGAVGVLNGNALFMDYHTEQTSTNCDGTTGAVSGPLAVTAGIGTGIALNAPGSTKSIYFNCAETWSGTTNITATGTITLVWDTLR
jgi:hypothetical protein